MALTDAKTRELYQEAMSLARGVMFSPLATDDEAAVAGETMDALLAAEVERIEASFAKKAATLRMLTNRLNGLSAALHTGLLETEEARLREIAAQLRDGLITIGEDVRTSLLAPPAPAPAAAVDQRLPPGELRMGDLGLDLIRHFEGFESEAYQDSVGVWTIGYGHTSNVRSGMVVTDGEAAQLLRGDVRDSAVAVQRRVEVPMLQQEFDALVSWTFNLGQGNLKASTLLKELNAGEHGKVPNEMRRWTRAGGEILDGLVRRRNSEANLWATGELKFDA